jgi:hypothetical protein
MPLTKTIDICTRCSWPPSAPPVGRGAGVRLLDHLIGGEDDGGEKHEAERLRGFQIDPPGENGRLLY